MTLSLSSCSNNHKLVLTRNSLLTNTVSTLEEATIKINANKLDLLINSKETFAFYYYSSNCTECTNSHQSVINYINNSKSLIYSASLENMSYSSYLDVYKKHPTILKEEVSLPYFILVSNGELYSEVSYNILSDSNAFNNYMNKNFDNRNIHQTFNCKDTKALINDDEIKYVYFYVRDDELANKALLELIKYCGQNKMIIVEELSFTDEQDLADIHAYSGVSTNHGPELVKYQKTIIINRYKITNENYTAINEIF